MLRALIFDFDGLIIDSETAVAGSWQELYAEHGVEFPDHLWRRMVGTREHDDLLWKHLSKRTGRAFDIPIEELARRERGLELASSLSLLPGVREHLDAARAASIALAIASSSSDWWVEGHLKRLGIAERFSAVCTKELVKRSKPDPAIYLVALERLGVADDEALAFEDSAAGVAAAKAAGLRVVAVPGSYTEHMDFSAADVVVESLADVDPQDLWQRFDAR